MNKEGELFWLLTEKPLINITQVCKQTGSSFPAATKSIHALEEIGIAREITGQQRNRIFAC
jgi:Fic family protein